MAAWPLAHAHAAMRQPPAAFVSAVVNMGHSSIVLTMDVYGHLFANGDDGSELAEAERDLFG